MTIDAVKEAFEQLSRQEQLSFEQWLAGRWDAEMDRDLIEGGRAATSMIREIEGELQSGRLRPLADLWDRKPNG